MWDVCSHGAIPLFINQHLIPRNALIKNIWRGRQSLSQRTVYSAAGNDPLSSTLFFFCEISLFFEYYVRVGQPCVYRNVR
jgi:hypothetical protein